MPKAHEALAARGTITAVGRRLGVWAPSGSIAYGVGVQGGQRERRALRSGLKRDPVGCFQA